MDQSHLVQSVSLQPHVTGWTQVRNISFVAESSPDRAGVHQPMTVTHAAATSKHLNTLVGEMLLTLLKINRNGAIALIRPQDKEGQRCSRRNHIEENIRTGRGMKFNIAGHIY